jgi:hypothetical protein
MAYRGTVHRGTPYRHVGPNETNRQGMEHGSKPGGMDGTSKSQFGSEKGGYRDEHVSGHGTPYQSRDGNPADAKRLVERSVSAESSDHGDQNDPHSNGPSVMLDVGDYTSGYAPRIEHTLDSPVPEHAPIFDRRTIRQEDRAHAGMRNEQTATDNILEIGGVLSRGQVGSSSRHGPETELLQDDEYGLEGHATQSQPRGSVKHLKE